MYRMMFAAAVVVFGLMPRAASAADDFPAGKVEGTVTNLTVGKSEKVSFTLSYEEADQKTARARGSFGNKELFGKFNVTGRIVNRTDGTISIQFTGVIELGDDNSGFPKGTRAEFVMTLLVRGKEIKGVYCIAPMPDFEIDFEQQGTMELKIVK